MSEQEKFMLDLQEIEDIKKWIVSDRILKLCLRILYKTPTTRLIETQFVKDRDQSLDISLLLIQLNKDLYDIFH